MENYKQTQRIMYLTDLNDTQKGYVKETILTDKLHSNYVFFYLDYTLSPK